MSAKAPGDPSPGAFRMPPAARDRALVPEIVCRNIPETAMRQDRHMNRQEEFVLRTIEERDIRFVRLWFTDVLGTLKSVAVAPAELEGAFAEGIGFDGSAI